MAFNKSNKPNAFVALVLAWLIPGAGHVYMGRSVRGIIIFVTIAATFWTGVGIGGVLAVDAPSERLWFICDMFTGVHGLYSYHRSNALYTQLGEDLSNDQEFQSATASMSVQAEKLKRDIQKKQEELRSPNADKARADREMRDLQSQLASILDNLNKNTAYYVDKKLADKGLALVAPADNVSRAYCGIAGMLNLMCIFDAFMLALMGKFGEEPRPRPEEKAA